MPKITRGWVFETNSSSTHSLSLSKYSDISKLSSDIVEFLKSGILNIRVHHDTENALDYCTTFQTKLDYLVNFIISDIMYNFDRDDFTTLRMDEDTKLKVEDLLMQNQGFLNIKQAIDEVAEHRGFKDFRYIVNIKYLPLNSRFDWKNYYADFSDVYMSDVIHDILGNVEEIKSLLFNPNSAVYVKY